MATYALSDLHGRLDLFHQIQEFIGPEDKVYFLGDAGDRGPNPWETIKAVFDDDRFIYLKGNHEEMLFDAYTSIKKYNYEDTYEAIALTQNGGLETLKGALMDPEGGKYINFIRGLPTWTLYNNEGGISCLLSHAGWTPSRYSVPDNFDLIWDRQHFYDPWSERDYGGVVVIHGHTPISYMWNFLSTPEEERITGAFWYCDNHKICIDSGAYATDIAILLNLDTFDEEIFYIPTNDE